MLDSFTAFWQKLLGNTSDEPQLNQEYRVAQVEDPYQNRPGYPASTFITNIRYRPKSNRVFVRMGGKTYVYPMNETLMAKWMSSNSLGQWYNKHLKLK